MKIYFLLSTALFMYVTHTFTNAVSLRSNPVCCLEPNATYSLPNSYTALLSVAFSPDGTLLAASHWGNDVVSTPVSYVTTFKVDDAKVLSQPTSYVLPDGSINRQPVTFSQDGSFLATFQTYAGSGVNGIILFTVNGTVLDTMTLYSMPLTQRPVGIAFSPDSSYLASANDLSIDVSIFPIANNTLGNSTSYPLPVGSDRPTSVAFSPDGALLAVSNCDSHDIALFALNNGTLNSGTLYPLPSGSFCPGRLAFSPDGLILASANYGIADDITLFKVDNGTLIQGTSYVPSPGSTSGFIYEVAFSPDGTLIITANSLNNGNTVTLFALTNGTLDAGQTYVSAVEPNSAVFSPDGSVAAVGNYGTADVRIFLVRCDTQCVSSNSSAGSSSAAASSSSSTFVSSSSSLANDGTTTSDGDGIQSSSTSILKSKLFYLLSLMLEKRE